MRRCQKEAGLVMLAHAADLQEVLELAGCVDEIREAAVNLGVVAGGGPLHEQLGAVILRRK